MRKCYETQVAFNVAVVYESAGAYECGNSAVPFIFFDIIVNDEGEQL